MKDVNSLCEVAHFEWGPLNVGNKGQLSGISFSRLRFPSHSLLQGRVNSPLPIGVNSP